jgi:hypothetical protein
MAYETEECIRIPRGELRLDEICDGDQDVLAIGDMLLAVIAGERGPRAFVWADGDRHVRIIETLARR